MWGLFSLLLVSFPLKPWGLFLCPGRQRKQNALFVPTVRKLKNHRHSLHKLIFILLFLLTFSTIFNRCLSVIVSVSPLCFQGGVLPYLCFKATFGECDRYFLLLPHFVHFALPSASVYSLLAPVVAI